MAIISEAHLDRADALLDFGSTKKLTGANLFIFGDGTDDIMLDIGNSDLEGMSVIFHVKKAITGATGVTFKVGVADEQANDFTFIAASPEIKPSDLKENQEIAVAIPRAAIATGRYLKAFVAVTGTVTDGIVSAYVDPYIGK